MISAVLIRVVRSIVAILIVVTLVFVVVRLTGDPIRSVLPENTPEDIVQQYRIKWGLNGSLWQQYVDYIKGLLHGDFGRSYFDDTGALNAVVTRVPATLELAVPAFVLSTVAGLGLGITAAVRKGSALDRIISSGSIAMAALPGFLLGVVLMLIFGVKLHWLPTAGNNGLDHLVLPVITMAGTTAGVLARITRTSMIEALSLPCLAHAVNCQVIWRPIATLNGAVLDVSTTLIGGRRTFLCTSGSSEPLGHFAAMRQIIWRKYAN